jgi:LPXTG-site transpeptidase (sortase) family protein
LLLIVSIAVIIVSSMIILFMTLNQSRKVSVAKLTSPTSRPISQSLIAGKSVKSNIVSEQTASQPSMRLKIPKINVDANVESVGLTSNGDMDVPIGSANAGWYNLGPRPGETGSAVIDGHFGVWKDGTVGVFNNLNKLQIGDNLYIQDGNGATLTFVVRELRTYDPTADASEVFGSSDGKAHLNLITCEGTWNAITKSYSNRLVVFTDKK